MLDINYTQNAFYIIMGVKNSGLRGVCQSKNYFVCRAVLWNLIIWPGIFTITNNKHIIFHILPEFISVQSKIQMNQCWFFLNRTVLYRLYWFTRTTAVPALLCWRQVSVIWNTVFLSQRSKHLACTCSLCITGLWKLYLSYIIRI